MQRPLNSKSMPWRPGIITKLENRPVPSSPNAEHSTWVEVKFLDDDVTTSRQLFQFIHKRDKGSFKMMTKCTVKKIPRNWIDNETRKIESHIQHLQQILVKLDQLHQTSGAQQ